MLPFFRKIRYQLAQNNQPASPAGRFLKYSRYAIGEIVLVVVGILIALYINNWNEDRKERKSEHLVLAEIKENLTYDLTDFESNLAHLKNKVLSSRTLLKAFKNDVPYHDSLGYFFSYLNVYPHFSSKMNGYKLLQSKGLGILTNNELRNKITTLYEDRYQYLLTFEKERIVYNKGPLTLAMSPYLGIDKLPGNQIPATFSVQGSVGILLDIGFFRNIRDYDQLKQDQEFHSMIKEIEIWSNALGTVHGSVQDNVIELIEEIENELNQK